MGLKFGAVTMESRSFPDGPVVKDPPVMQRPQRLHGTVGSIRGLGRSAGGGQGHPLQYSCLENPMEEPVGLWDHQELHMTEVT